jgi:hypothetical protein
VDISPTDILAQRQDFWVARPTLKAIDQEQSFVAVHHWTVWSSICGPYFSWADGHWRAAEREILTESTATPTGVQQKPRSKKSDWRRELRIKFFGMLFGVGIAAAGAVAFSLGAHHNASAPASPGTRESAAPASAPKVGAEVTASNPVEATSVDTDRASTSDVTSGDAITCEASGAWAEETRQMGQLEEHGPMFRKPRRPRLRPGQSWNTPNPSHRMQRYRTANASWRRPRLADAELNNRM